MQNHPHKPGPSGNSGAAKSEVIVQGTPVASGAVAAAISLNPKIQLVAKIAKDIVVLRATGSDLDALKSQFPGLLIEPNEELRH